MHCTTSQILESVWVRPPSFPVLIDFCTVLFITNTEKTQLPKYTTFPRNMAPSNVKAVHNLKWVVLLALKAQNVLISHRYPHEFTVVLWGTQCTVWEPQDYDSFVLMLHFLQLINMLLLCKRKSLLFRKCTSKYLWIKKDICKLLSNDLDKLCVYLCIHSQWAQLIEEMSKILTRNLDKGFTRFFSPLLFLKFFQNKDF